MIFKTIKERLLMLTAKSQVRIYSNRYDIYIASGLVIELEQTLPQKLMEMEVSGISDNGIVVELFID